MLKSHVVNCDMPVVICSILTEEYKICTLENSFVDLPSSKMGIIYSSHFLLPLRNIVKNRDISLFSFLTFMSVEVSLCTLHLN